MTRIIRIERCDDCEHADHKGAFGKVSCVPVCRKDGRELPHKVEEQRGRMVAVSDGKIPDWCPLENAV